MIQYVIRSNEGWADGAGDRFLVLAGGAVVGVPDSAFAASKWSLPADAAIAFAAVSGPKARRMWDLCELDTVTGEISVVGVMAAIIGEGVAADA